MATFSAEHAVPVDVVGARQAADPVTGAEAIAFALQPDDGGDLQVFSLSICTAYDLREVIDEALEAPFSWDDGESGPTGLDELDGLAGSNVIELPRPPSARWGEAWATSHPR
ncbi:MAG TPA: hypothetical protein VNQ33_12615 [Acidimicrobiales bacterium]|nr:hypothetical protein [Acidimicrobiales bacterium]